MCDAAGRPLGSLVTAGQRHESPLLLDLILSTPLSGPMPKRTLGDKGYSSPRNRRLLRALGSRAVIPMRKDELARLAELGLGRPRFERKAYKGRNVIERLVGRLKEYRRIATRYEKLAVNFHSMIRLACIRFFLNQ
jgi:transposase